MRFWVPDEYARRGDLLAHAYLAGAEGIPARRKLVYEAPYLSIVREANDSCYGSFLWDYGARTPAILTTASLRERAEPYHLTLELARGTLHRLKSQTSVWDYVGIDYGQPPEGEIDDAEEAFLRAAVAQRDPVACHLQAQRSLEIAATLLDRVTRAAAEKALETRRQDGPLATMFGVQLDPWSDSHKDWPRILGAFNSISVPLVWNKVQPDEGQHDWAPVNRALEWAASQGLHVCAGPILRFDRAFLPDWLQFWNDDFAAMQAHLLRYVREAAQACKGKVHFWHAVAGVNNPGMLKLQPEQALRLTVAAIDVLRQVDPDSPILVSFDQPFAESFVDSEAELASFHMAESLAHADVGIAGIGIELDLGYQPHGTLPRTLWEMHLLLERWRLTQLPLVVRLSAPEAPAPVVAGHDRTEFVAQPRSDLFEELLPVIAAKDFVYGVFWKALYDRDDPRFPRSGLFEGPGRPTPLLETFARFRKRCGDAP
ncbi:MAG TPA: endo-1,4-beta-xylanase [Pirellulaceae bacterium]|jgi:hypothetical protein|nr:endo-1,4-beta-xylanase [Pirellulaceae bacterium]